MLSLPFSLSLSLSLYFFLSFSLRRYLSACLSGLACLVLPVWSCLSGQYKRTTRKPCGRHLSLDKRQTSAKTSVLTKRVYETKAIERAFLSKRTYLRIYIYILWAMRTNGYLNENENLFDCLIWDWIGLFCLFLSFSLSLFTICVSVLLSNFLIGALWWTFIPFPLRFVSFVRCGVGRVKGLV
ncbi:hypothetical protein IWX50DRAFT_636773, partial [Phyllosticta citricarpa]